MNPQEYCQEKARASGSNFVQSFRFLNQEQKEAITALYAFCREIDDVVDECTDVGVAARKLHWWREEIERMAKGDARHPVTLAMSPFQTIYGLTLPRLHDLIDGMQMDLNQNRYADFAGLKLYCYRVAGVVGLMASEIFGRSQEQTLQYADRLGLALQLTNIIRDVGDDARKGRIYLPLEDLDRFKVSQQDIIKCVESAEFLQLMQFQAERARGIFKEAYELLPTTDRRKQKVGLMMAAVYADLLSEIQNNGFKVLNHRTSLTPHRKLWLVLKVWLLAQPHYP